MNTVFNRLSDGFGFVPGLSFLYDGVPFAALDKQVEPLSDGVRFTLPDGLVLTCTLRRFPAAGVIWWVNRWENPTDHASGLVTDLWDCDVVLPLPEKTLRTGYKGTRRVIATKGMTDGGTYCRSDKLSALEKFGVVKFQ